MSNLAPVRVIPESQIEVICKPHALQQRTVTCFFQVGTSIAEIVGPEADDNIAVRVNGVEVPRDMWPRVKPKQVAQIQIMRVPRGKTVKKVIGVILLIVIAYFAPYLLNWAYAAFGFWGAVAAIGITLIATMAAYALIPPPEMPKLDSGAMEGVQRLNAITGTSNQANPYGTIPMVLGENRYYPTLAANPYTEILGDQQYLRMLFDLGWGQDLVVSDIKIGETDISSFEEVEYEISTVPDLFSDDMFELSIAESMNVGQTATRTTQLNTDEVSLDLVFPGGLFGANDKGATTGATTSFTIEYRATGAGSWINVATTIASPQLTISSPAMSVIGSNFSVTSSKRQVLRLGVRFAFPSSGQYDVRVTRNGTTYGSGTQDSAKFDTAQWVVIRSIKHTNPSTTGTLKLALRIRATDQLNGVINQLSVLAQQKVRTWTGAAWTAPTATFNPAWVYHWLMTTSPGVAVKVADSRMDITRIKLWADYCDTMGLTCKGMVDRAVAFSELIKMVLSSGLASFAMRDGMYSVLYDREGQTPIQSFAPTNSKNFSGQRMFVDMPHALRVKFSNPEVNWQEDEIIVVDDLHSYNGKNARGAASGLPPATKFETLTVPFVTEPKAAWILGRYQLAQGTFRSNLYSWECDVENLICSRGDLVYREDDVVDWGDGFGLVSSVSGSGNISVINTAEPLTYVSGEAYSIRVRSKVTGNSYVSAINTSGWVAGTEYTSFTLSTPFSTGSVDMGDLYMIGRTSQLIRQCLITKIEPGPDLSARLEAVEYSASVSAYVASPPTTFVSAISGTVILEPPPPPNITAAFSNYAADPSTGGTTNPTVNITVDPGTSGYKNNGGGWNWRNEVMRTQAL
jgi:hypothetical protein